MPRLELIANHMNVNIGFLYIYNALSKVVEVKQVCMWTDSQIALRWITNPQLPWKQFVVNRVRKINEKGKEMKVKWLYCPTEDNPADVSTQGFKASQLTDKWWKRPDWLLDKSKWPEQPVIEPSKLSEEERKQIKEIHLFTAVKTKDNIGNLITRKILLVESANYQLDIKILSQSTEESTSRETNNRTNYYGRTLKRKNILNFESAEGSRPNGR